MVVVKSQTQELGTSGYIVPAVKKQKAVATNAQFTVFLLHDPGSHPREGNRP